MEWKQVEEVYSATEERCGDLGIQVVFVFALEFWEKRAR